MHFSNAWKPKVRQLAGEAGGMRHLKQLVDVLAE